jgi:hypothetical protein
MPDDPSELGGLFTEEEAATLRQMPVEVVIGNHVFHLLELAALHLSAQPPQLEPARVTIDAVAGLMSGVAEELGEHGALLREALSQIQIAYVAVAQSADAD